MKPLCIELFAGLHGFGEGFIAEGYRVIGFDIVDMCAFLGHQRLPGIDLVLQDVLTLHGSQFKDAAVIVASPPCQEYSYMAMPWSRGKQIAAEYRSGVRDVKQLTALFDACFRIQREACEAAGRYIPLIVENVRGAQPWVGRSRWHYGSFHLWGDVPALMPMTFRGPDMAKVPGFRFDGSGRSFQSESVKTIGHANIRDGHTHTRHLTNQSESDAIKQGGDWLGRDCESSISRRTGSKSTARKAASAQIAKIPFALSKWIAKCFKPDTGGEIA